jgi:hypothetical protein
MVVSRAPGATKGAAPGAPRGRYLIGWTNSRIIATTST